METRTIELSLDTAKRWYEQGGELRDLAIGAFGDKMLIGDRLPRTWDEYCIKHGENGDKIKASLNTAYTMINKYTFSDYKQTEAHIAMMKLHLLRDEYRNGWLPDWKEQSVKHTILIDHDDIVVGESYVISCFLAFQTEELAEQFLGNFRDLIEEAGDLI